MLFHRWAYDGFLNPQCKLVKEKEKEKEPLMPVRSHQHLSLSLSLSLSLHVSLSHHPIAAIQRMLKVWMLQANCGKTDILKAKYKCKHKWYLIWSLEVLVLRGNTKASWSSTTGKAGRQARHFPKIHEAINQVLGFSELFPITDGLEDEIIRLPSSTTNKQTVGGCRG
jgi:hypothetical protein